MNDNPRPATEYSPGRYRYFYLVLAWLALLMAVAGALLPLIPGTPFLLLAVWAAVRGSRRLHDWIFAQPQLARLIYDWREQGAIPRYAKWLASLMMVVSCLYLIWAEFHWVLVTGLALFLAGGATFIWTRPDPVVTRK